LNCASDKIQCYKNKQDIDEPKIYKLSKKDLDNYELRATKERKEMELREEVVYPHINHNQIIR
jgi:hypothetical protein